MTFALYYPKEEADTCAHCQAQPPRDRVFIVVSDLRTGDMRVFCTSKCAALANEHWDQQLL